jgi:hypothetical protein
MLMPSQRLHDVYEFAFPDDFFDFRDFLGGLPPGILAEACDMQPAYPFDVADGRPPKDYPEQPLWQDRYYHDLPEFITLFKGTTDGLHWGYFVDAPGEYPPVVAHYWHSDTFQHTIDGDTVFEAVRWQVELSERCFLEMADETPEEADYCRRRLEQLAVIRDALARSWKADRPETGDDYLNAFGGSAWRTPVAPTWSQLGIVLPPEQYRPLFADPFRGSFVEPMRPEIEGLAEQAMRFLAEGFPGAALKLGHDLWGWADEFPECYALLDAAYVALGREPLRNLLAAAHSFRKWCASRRRPPT